jgi:hypothetical protein
MQKSKRFLFLLPLLILLNSELLSQDTLSVTLDSFFIKKNTSVVYQDTIIVFRKDTLLIVPDSSVLKIKDSPFVRWFNQYMTVEKPIEKLNRDSEMAAPYQEQEIWYDGKVIENIYIKKLDVFGTSILDTTWINDSGLIRFGNKLHIKTNNFVIRNNLVFKKGEQISPLLLRESERILRSREHIRDARIYVIPIEGNPDKVNILVVEKDIWSLGFTLKPRNVNAANIGIREINLLGTGHELGSTFFVDLDEKTEYQVLYRVPNLGKTFTSAQVIYSSEVDNEIFEVSIDKDFITAETKFGGGLGYRQFNGVDTSYLLPETFENQIKLESTNGWLGWSVLQKQKTLSGWQQLIIATGVYYDQFLKSPLIVRDSNLQYQDHTLLLGSLTYSERNYYKSNYMFGFGRTEDVPLGQRIELTLGYDFGQILSRPYAGISYSQSHRFNKLGYISNEYLYGSFFREGKLDEGMLQIKSSYITPLLGREKRFKQRFVLLLNGTFGINQRNNRIVDIRNRNGIRALKSHQLRGQAKAFMNSTYIVFSPWKLLGFRLAFSGHIDVGFVAKNASELLKQDPYWGLSYLIEANNENLIFGVLQLGISYFPNTPDDVSSIGFTVGTRRTLTFRDFEARRPDIARFGDFIAREE